MTILLAAMDPLGRTIILEERQWSQHICRDHPGMEYEWIAQCLASPDFIACDAVYPERRVYYKRRFLLLASVRRFYLKVVIELPTENQDPCRVITAFIATTPKMGERLEWPIRSD